MKVIAFGFKRRSRVTTPTNLGAPATGGGLTTATVPDDVMDRLLVGATESYTGACRAVYPMAPVADSAVVSRVEVLISVTASCAELTASVLVAMEEKAPHRRSHRVGPSPGHAAQAEAPRRLGRRGVFRTVEASPPHRAALALDRR